MCSPLPVALLLMIMQNFLYILVGLIGGIPLSAQNYQEIEWLGPMGEVLTDSPSQLSVSFTLGEVHPYTLEGGGFTFTEGFQQPDLQSFFNGTPSDSVWPGDANQDLVANHFDLLPIGMTFGQGGSPRTNATNNWAGQFALNWLGGFPTGVNYKHADCNGDGVVNANDTLAIDLNYGLTHNKGETEDNTGPDLAVIIQNDTLIAGDTLVMDIHFGNDSFPVANAYGLAFTLNLDTALVVQESFRTSFVGSWLGDKGNDMITLVKPFPSHEGIDIALTRIDQLNRNGMGFIARGIIMIDDLSGKNGLLEEMQISISNVSVISRDGTPVPYSTRSDSVVVADPEITSLDPELNVDLRLFPNPARDFVEISVKDIHSGEMSIVDMKGRIVWQVKGKIMETTTIPVNLLADGAYLFQLRTEKGIGIRKFTIRH